MDAEESQTPDKSGVSSIENEADDKSSSTTGKEISIEIEETMGFTDP